MKTTNIEKKYRITKEQCQSNIDKRMPVVCTHCGGKTEPIETVDNSGNPTYWQGCNDCEIFTSGTSPKIYETAVKMVDERRFRVYGFKQMPDKEKEPSSFDYWRKSQIGGTVDVVTDILILHGILSGNWLNLSYQKK